MKNTRASATIYYVAAALFGLAAILCFVGGSRNSNGVVFLRPASALLCPGSSHAKKSREGESK